jgi:hypothetical protein
VFAKSQMSVPHETEFTTKIENSNKSEKKCYTWEEDKMGTASNTWVWLESANECH